MGKHGYEYTLTRSCGQNEKCLLSLKRNLNSYFEVRAFESRHTYFEVRSIFSLSQGLKDFKILT